jgi:hypothetical protein
LHLSLSISKRETLAWLEAKTNHDVDESRR